MMLWPRLMRASKAESSRLISWKWRPVVGSDEIGEFHALVLTAGERAAVLSQMDIAESDVLEGFQAVHDGFLIVFAEELNGLGNGHLQDVVDVLLMEAHVEYLSFESLAVAGFTGEREVGHELHFHGDDTGTLTFLTTATVGVEGEILGREAHLLGKAGGWHRRLSHRWRDWSVCSFL